MQKQKTGKKPVFVFGTSRNSILLRYAKGTNPMDNLTYQYNPGTNQLQFVDDAIADGDYTVDIDDQDTLNYRYDKNGNLVFDAAEEIVIKRKFPFLKLNAITG